MCKTCNGTGGIHIERRWGISFHPCPSDDCDYDRDREVEKMLQYIDAKLVELENIVA